jgi:SAM-dependent methyltransferase
MEKRFSKMGISAVFSTNFSKREREKITKIHEKIIFKILKKKLKKRSKVLDFGCGYGRFSNFFVKKFSSFYFGVERSKSLLKNLKNEKKKKFLDYSNFVKSRKFKEYFDLCFVFSVLGGYPKNKIKKYVKILKNSIKPNGLIFFVETISDIDIEGEWRFRTINFYKSLFSDFKISSEFYFLEDGRNRRIFWGKKINP